MLIRAKARGARCVGKRSWLPRGVALYADDFYCVRRRPGGNGKNMFIVAIKPESLPWRISNGYTTAVSHPIKIERGERE